MNKLFWSAFAMSLCLLIVPSRSLAQNMEDFLGLEESEVLLRPDKDYYDAEKKLNLISKGPNGFPQKIYIRKMNGMLTKNKSKWIPSL